MKNIFYQNQTKGHTIPVQKNKQSKFWANQFIESSKQRGIKKGNSTTKGILSAEKQYKGEFI